MEPIWKMVLQLLIKLNTYITHDPEISLLNISPNETITYILTGDCTQMFIAVLLQ